MIRHQYILFIPFLTLLGISFSGCAYNSSADQTVEEEKVNVEKTSSDSLPPKVPLLPVSPAIRQFAVDVYAQIRSQEGNLFFSPYSLSAALTMSYAGARGKTKEEMAKVLHLEDMPNESGIHERFGQLERTLSSSDAYHFNIANAIWLQRDKFFLATGFVELLQDVYHLGVKTADFGNHAEEKINAWVARQTGNKIPELLKPELLTAQTQWVLVNAMYFKGTWQSPFRSDETKPLSFSKFEGEPVTVPIMHKKGWLNYFEDEHIQMLELPYRASEGSPKLVMVMVLPHKTDQTEFSKIEANLNDYLSRQEKLEPSEITVYLPKFKVNTALNLHKTLRELGMVEAFESGQADFSGMSSNKELVISEVVHQAFVEVNEEGTEAAAATSVIGSRGHSPVFRADHPFIFWIFDKDSETILFLGRVLDPSV